MSSCPSALVFPGPLVVRTLLRAGMSALRSYFCNRRRRGVAQIFNLLYRRFAIGRLSPFAGGSGTLTARQNAILRYSRLKICATSVKYAGWLVKVVRNNLHE